MFNRFACVIVTLASLTLQCDAAHAEDPAPVERLGAEQTYWITNEGIYAKARPILDGPYAGHVVKTPGTEVRAATATETPAPPPAPASDPYGFTNWLNQTRARYGLRPVGYDPNLEAWAHQNNLQQAARGMGHFIMGAARRQNSAMGSYASIPSMWMQSPGHQSALLDPTITFIGLAGYGAFWTYNAR